MTDKQKPECWMTQAERLRAMLAHADRHCISSDVVFAVLVALEDAFFIQSDGDEYNNDEAIAAFKALEAEIATQNNAVPAAGSDGSHSDGNRVRASDPPTGNTQEPVAWYVASDGYEYATLLREHAEAIASEEGGTVSPLYHTPKPALTDEEREAVEQAIDTANGMAQIESWALCTLRKLLERLS
jgi:hypothetical protein